MSARRPAPADAPPVGRGGLQLREMPRLQERIWTVQRIGWAGFALAVAAAVAGLTGSGGALSRHEVTAGAIRAGLPRIARRDAEDRIVLDLPAAARVTLAFDAGFLADFDLVAVDPAPAAARAEGAGLRLEILGDPAAGFTIRLRIRPRSFGRAAGRIGIGPQEIPFAPLILP